MRLKIEQKAVIIDLYAEQMDNGLDRHEIAAFINQEMGLDCAESTYRKIYQAHETLKRLEDNAKEEHTDKLAVYTRRDIRQREERKRLVRERALVEQQVKDYVDKSAVAMAIQNMWARPLLPMTPKVLEVIYEGTSLPVYAYGDIHWGYTIDTPTIKYNKEIAAGRLDAIFAWISEDIFRRDLKQVYIADLGDDIEGAALRPSQLLRIVESMTEQAKGYATYIQGKIQALAEMHPDTSIDILHVSEDNHAQLRLHNTSRDELPENLQLLICDRLDNFVETAHGFGALMNVTYTYAPEVLVNINGINLLFAHSHQYKKNDNLLDMAKKRHQCDIHVFVGAHWHSYKHTNRDVFQGIQQSLIFVNAVVGDTDYSERLFYSGLPGFTKLDVQLEHRCVTSKQIIIDAI